MKAYKAAREMPPKEHARVTEYCPMNGTEAMDSSDYLEPREDLPETGYIPMAPPPDYDSCVPPQSRVTYANTKETGEPNIDMACETGYDVPAPMNVYSEIPEDDNDDVIDDDGNHIYESLDQSDHCSN